MPGNMTVNARLILLVVASLAVVVFNQAVSYFGSRSLQTTTQDIGGRRAHQIHVADAVMFLIAENRPGAPTSRLHDYPAAKHLDKIAGSANESVESTRAIAGMTRQVKDIADLLALNAAIEAARAGEQGCPRSLQATREQVACVSAVLVQAAANFNSRDIGRPEILAGELWTAVGRFKT